MLWPRWSSCLILVLLFLSSSCLLLLLSCSYRLAALDNFAFSFGPFHIFLVFFHFLLWSFSSFGCVGESYVFLLFLMVICSNRMGLLGVVCCLRAAVANRVYSFCYLSRITCSVCPRPGSVHHRFTRGLFLYLYRFIWVCFRMTMNTTMVQRSKCDIIIGFSHDIYPASHRFAHVTQALGIWFLVSPIINCLGAIPKQLEFLEKHFCIHFHQYWIFRIDADADKNADVVWGLYWIIFYSKYI